MGAVGAAERSQMVAVTVGGCPHIGASLGSVGPSGEGLGSRPLGISLAVELSLFVGSHKKPPTCCILQVLVEFRQNPGKP